MAYLDNSGDIILDAVLTYAGRRKLSRGFALDIRSFGLGDDEINYASYNGSDSRGSAYYDLEILQTPVLESITGRPGGINHGLLKMEGRTEILYLPELMMNTLSSVPTTVGEGASMVAAARPITKNFRPGSSPGGSKVIYLPCTADTVDEFMARADSRERYWQTPAAVGGGPIDTCFLFVSGLNTDELDPTETNLRDYVYTNDLFNNEYILECDRRLFASISIPGDFGYSLDRTTGDFLFAASGLIPRPVGSGPDDGTSEFFNYVKTRVRAVVNNTSGFDGGVTMFERDPGVTDGASYSSRCPIRGPLADAMCFVPEPDISTLGTTSVNRLWTDLGKFTNGTNAGLDGTWTGNYYWIDTRIYLTGIRTGVSTSFVIRLIRKA